MKFEPIEWWPGAFHVFDHGADGKTRLGIVNSRNLNGRKPIWFAHNKHFFSVEGQFVSRKAAAEALPTTTIKHKASALSGAR